METLHRVGSFYRPKEPDHDLNRPILELTDVGHQFNGTIALKDISFKLHRGEQAAIVGPNGAGKSTLFNIISGILKPTRGRVDVYGHIPGDHICIAYVPQRNQVDWQFPVNVADVVMMGRVGKMGLFKWPRRRDWEIVHQALELVGMRQFAGRQIGELSGGQQQRVFIARSVAQEAELMLMDEPLTGLDVKSQEAIFGIFRKLRERNVTLLITTHDLNLAAKRFDRLMLLNQSIIGFGKAEDVFTPALLNRAYSGQMHLIETANGVMALGDTCCGGGEEHPHA